MSSYTGWYKDGTASATNGTTAVTGVNTYWSTAGIHPGDLLTFDDGNTFAEIASVNSDTSITLAKAFTQGTKAGAAYAIVRNFTAGTLPEVASQVIDALRKYTRYFNEDIATLNGKSAYEVAVENGYTGTVAQWLESLKAAGEWQTLNERTNILTSNYFASHNALYRRKYLGTTMTAAQLSAIENGTFEDIYPGDYWQPTIDGTQYTFYVGGCNHHGYWVNSNYTWEIQDSYNMPNHIVLLFTSWSNFNETATTEGSIYNSYLHNTTFPQLVSLLEEWVGAEHVLSKPVRIADSVDSSGINNHYILSDEKIFAATQAEIMGVYDPDTSYPDHRRQLPFFACGFRWGNGLYNLDAPGSTSDIKSIAHSNFCIVNYPANMRRPRFLYSLIG